MKTGMFVFTTLLISAATSFAGANAACALAGAADSIFAMGAVIGFMIPAVCIIAADHSRKTGREKDEKE